MIEIRPATIDDAAGIGSVHVQSWQSTYRGIVSDDYLDNLSRERSTASWHARLAEACGAGLITFVAVGQSGRIVGFAAGGPETNGMDGFKAELQVIYLLESYQRQGIGRRLVRRIRDELGRAGLWSMIVWVLAQNSATSFYQALGGVEVARKSIEIGGASHTEIAYGWSDTRAMRL